MKFEPCLVQEIEKVDYIPGTRLTQVHIKDKVYVSGLMADHTPQHVVGDYVVVLPAKTRMPEWLLKREGFWDRDRGKGILGGAKGNIVKEQGIEDYISQGILVPTWCLYNWRQNANSIRYAWLAMGQRDHPPQDLGLVISHERGYEKVAFAVGEDVTEFLGLNKK